jgi:hypothetical protein
MMEIVGPESRFSLQSLELRRVRRGELTAIGMPSGGAPRESLFARDAAIVALADAFGEASGPNAIIDISCLPKRFFFPCLHRLLNNPKIANLVATYTVPERYHDGRLAEDHQPFAHLPLFGPREFPERPVGVVIVGVGFVRLGLHELLQLYRERVDVRALLSFPPGQPGFARNWDFIRELEVGVPGGLGSPTRIEGYDVPDIFDHIVEFTGRNSQQAVFAPFGPKSMSLAMCLYARLANSSVYYTQPTVYHPEYSTGVKTINGGPVSYAYCLRIDGRDLYTL